MKETRATVMRATQDLMAEHRIIERVLGALERVVTGAERTSALPATFLARLVTFSRSFVDRCHHGKEEGCLFPCLAKRGVPVDGGPIHIMLQEHEEGRRLVGVIEEALTRYQRGGAVLHEVLAPCRDYVDLLRTHIEKETRILFPIGEAVAAGDDEAMQQCFEGREASLGPGMHETLTELAETLCAAADVSVVGDG